MKDIFKHIDLRVEQKRKTGRHSTADLYRASGNRLQRFFGNKPLPFSAITASLVADFKNYLKDQGLKPNTVVSYLSSLRAIYNMARKDKLFTSSQQPFAGLKLKPEITVKPVIPFRTMEEVASLDLHKEPELELAAHINSFSFMACGMPFADISRLTADNLQDGILVYNRHKTGTQVCIHITRGMQKLIDKYQSPETPFLFPILKSKEVKYNTYKKILNTYNKQLLILGTRLPVPCKLTSYSQRRVWAQEAQRQHMPLCNIRLALGHTSEKTTQFYLKGSDPSELFRANEPIIKDVNISVLKDNKTLFTE
ncbi:MAG: tyrosine-type recombinase/integrase [Parabacteroides gordonii]|uniref:tyrosine-type recombinase/integrase n=1 Tax=Parabacteroides gordonii TaxID=574930 RepID=UPI003A85ACBC